MARRPEPETIDVEPSAEPPIRPEEGYRVGARISVADAGRTRAAGIAAGGIVVMGLVLSIAGQLLPAAPEDADADLETPAVATALPALVTYGEPPDRPIPVYAGGLRWLDPAGAAMSGDPYRSPRNGLFVDPEGQAICLCIERPWSRDGYLARVTLVRYDATGDEVGQATIRELISGATRVFGDPVTFDATVSADGATMWIARAVREAGQWAVGVDRVDLGALAITASVELPPIPVPEDEASILGPDAAGWITHARAGLRPVVRANPSGTRVSVGLAMFLHRELDPRLPVYQVGRYLLPGDLDTPGAAALADPAHDAVLDPCDAGRAAWATDAHLVTLCVNAQGTTIQPFARIETPDGAVDEVAVGPAVGRQDSAWLLDAATGAIFRWSSQAHVLTRLDVAARETTTLAVERSKAGDGAVDAWPAAREAAALWTSFAGAEANELPVRLVGSGDGSVLYAIGFRSVPDPRRDDRQASTGIWVIDAERAVLVAHWPADALYNEVGFTPGRDQLMTIAMPGLDANGAPADWATSIRFHDAYLGSVTRLLGDTEEASGFIPLMLPANVPSTLAGG